MIISDFFRTYKRINFYKSLLPTKNALVFDIGAHVGKKTVVFLSCGWKVVAIEPQKNCIHALQKIKSKYDDLTIENIAISNFEGFADLYPGSHTETSTLSLEFKSVYESIGTAEYSTPERVPVHTLDYLIKKYGQPLFLKIDSEGHDLIIIKNLRTKINLIEFEYLKPFSKDVPKTLKHLDTLGRYQFNFCRNEEPHFYFSQWQFSDDFIQRIGSLPGDILHGNIYARIFSS